jgi:nuclear pore complex protein Nup210
MILFYRHEVSLNASGGDGSFVWSSYNASVAVVTQTGVVKTQALGHTEVSAVMTRNHHNQAVASVYVLPASHLQIVEYMLEAELGSPIHLHVAVFADRPGGPHPTNTRIPFTHCDDLPLTVKTWNDNFQNSSLKITPAGLSCTTVAVVGHSAGTSKVAVSYSSKDHTMTDSTVIGAYRPLTVTHPSSGETVLAIGTSREVMFSGGPRPWIVRSSKHVHEINIEGDDDILEVAELSGRTADYPDVYIYRIVCRKLGEVGVALRVTNRPSAGHCTGSVSTATLKVRCAKPRYVSLASELKVADSSCPLNVNSEKLVTQNYRQVELLVTVKDEHGRAFDNVTSLYFDWKLSEPSLGNIQEKGAVIAEDVQERGITLPHRQYQVLTPRATTGLLEVTVAIVAYRTHMLALMDIVPEDPPFGITGGSDYVYTPEIVATLSLLLVNDTVITPNRTSVFNHPQNVVNLKVSQGSGYYEFVLSSHKIADVNYLESTGVLEVVPKLDGVLKLTLVDLCLVSRPAIVEIQVLGVGSIRMEVADRVEQGQSVSAIVSLYDTADNPLPVPATEFLDLRAVPDSGIVSVELQQEDHKAPSALGEIRYAVTGLQLGETGLKFVSGRGKREIHSQHVFIQVFPPLRLFPRNMTLIAGSKFQITSRGGPQSDAYIEYTVASAGVVTISSVGVVTGDKLGASLITGNAVGVNKATGQKVVYSQDSINVNVVPLQGIKIHAPLTRLKSGTSMPVWAEGIPNMLSPIIIGSVEPSLKFAWSVTTREVGVVRHIFEDFGLVIAEEDMVSMRFTATSPGHTVLRLDVYFPAEKGGRADVPHFHDSLEIGVFEELLLVRPPRPPTQQSPVLIMAPNSEVQLKTNRDGLVKKVTYSLGGTLLPVGHSSFGNETVSKALADTDQPLVVEATGLVRSHSRMGRSVIMVEADEDFGIKQVLSVIVEVSPNCIGFTKEGESLKAWASCGSYVGCSVSEI